MAPEDQLTKADIWSSHACSHACSHTCTYTHMRNTHRKKKKNVCNICLYYCNLFIGYLASLIWPTFLWKQYIHEFHMKEHLKNLHSKKWYMILFISSIRSLGHWFYLFILLYSYFTIFLISHCYSNFSNFITSIHHWVMMSFPGIFISETIMWYMTTWANLLWILLLTNVQILSHQLLKSIWFVKCHL